MAEEPTFAFPGDLEPAEAAEVRRFALRRSPIWQRVTRMFFFVVMPPFGLAFVLLTLFAIRKDLSERNPIDWVSWSILLGCGLAALWLPVIAWLMDRTRAKRLAAATVGLRCQISTTGVVVEDRAGNKNLRLWTDPREFADLRRAYIFRLGPAVYGVAKRNVPEEQRAAFLAFIRDQVSKVASSNVCTPH